MGWHYRELLFSSIYFLVFSKLAKWTYITFITTKNATNTQLPDILLYCLYINLFAMQELGFCPQIGRDWHFRIKVGVTAGLGVS